ncbi:RcpC/CpaB family pilus assembly protein [Candidatus Poriferisodalis sp.]|uniref:RcpC/CpaB family pilus assembly protein n=1 Tax=Candidatus Poriferisodalis sp. TaxID=3101277 RepID=UPI003B02A85E
MAGSVLCGVAALGLWWAFEQSAAAPETSYLVARTRLAPGRVIEAADVALVSIRLPAEVSATVFGSGDEVVGGLVVDAIHAGELLTRGDIGSHQSIRGRETGYAIAVELNRPGALNGLVAAGERVDVIAAGRRLADASGPLTAGLVAANALVLDVDDISGAEHLSDTITVTLQVRDRAAAIAVAATADAGAITLIRPWGAVPPATS